MFDHTVFVPSGDSRRDTAVLLVGTAREYDIDQHSIKMVQGGFRITEELADVLYSDTKSKRTARKRAAKPSGNRAAKNVTNKE
jgi:hypothetical protein